MGNIGMPRRRLLGAALGVATLCLASPLQAAERYVTDMAGRRVRLPGRIERIASAGGSPAVNAFLFLFGQGERIVTGLPAAFRPSRFYPVARNETQVDQTYGGGSAPDFHGNSLLSSWRFQCLENLKRLAPCQ